MFRKMVRVGQQLSQEECIEILKKEKRGVLSVIGDDGYPYGMPLNHYYVPEENRLYFHGGMSGHKIDAMKRCDKVSYCVYGNGTQEDWYLTFKSVIVFGKVTFIEDKEIVKRISRELSYQFTDDNKYIDGEIERSLDRTLMFAIDIENMTGKYVREK